MRAVIYNGIKQIDIEDRPQPEIGPKDVLVKNMRAGICGTDIGAYLSGGDSVGIFPGNQIGHEFTSQVVTVGADVTDERIQPGTRVWVNPSNSAPADEGRSFLEITDSAGGLSEFIAVRNAEIGFNLFPLPDNVSWDQAALIEPLSVGNHAVNVGAPQPGQKAVVFGAGAVGLAVLANLKAKGIEEVIVSDIVDSKLKVVEQLGGIPVNGKEQDPVEFAIERFGAVQDMNGNTKADVDFWFDSSGAPNSVPDFLRGAKRLSTLVIVAIGKKDVTIPHSDFALGEITIKGALAYDTNDNAEVIQYLAEEKYDPSPMVTHHFRQEDVVKAFEQVINHPQDTIKVLIDVHP